MEPIWAAVVAGVAVLFLGVDFWWDKRKDDKRTRAAIVRAIAVRDAHEEYLEENDDYPRYDAEVDNDPMEGNTPEAKYNRNIGRPVGHGQEPQAYYQPHNDLYILPLRSYEWEAIRFALATMSMKSMYLGDRTVIQRRMENAEK